MDFEKYALTNVTMFILHLDFRYYPSTPPTEGDKVRAQISTDAENA